MASTNDLKNGMTLDLDGGLWNVVEFQHVKPGKGGAFVRTTLKNVTTGKVVDRTFNAGVKVEVATVDKREMTYLYREGEDFVFMDTESYDQIQVPAETVGSAADYMLENTNATVALHEPGTAESSADAVSPSHAPCASATPMASAAAMPSTVTMVRFVAMAATTSATTTKQPRSSEARSLVCQARTASSVPAREAAQTAKATQTSGEIEGLPGPFRPPRDACRGRDRPRSVGTDKILQCVELRRAYARDAHQVIDRTERPVRGTVGEYLRGRGGTDPRKRVEFGDRGGVQVDLRRGGAASAGGPRAPRRLSFPRYDDLLAVDSDAREVDARLVRRSEKPSCRSDGVPDSCVSR